MADRLVYSGNVSLILLALTYVRSCTPVRGVALDRDSLRRRMRRKRRKRRRRRRFKTADSTFKVLDCC